ncbi:lamin tail domain-containing protein [Candidatus Acetothermia bacterium]|nr:lamin tail domain-containing protein [Candidatus Acetothermia bacterium]MBI3644074.1 lamin tail domain-containing protein [Candidatus Acetothermia bacterium]
MKIARVLLFVFFGLSVSVAFSAQQQSADKSCSPILTKHDSLHIAWIDCSNRPDPNIAVEDEILIIVNGSNQPMNLTGFEVKDANDHTFVFSDINTLNKYCCQIKSHDLLRIHSGPANKDIKEPESDHDLYWQNAEVWNNDHDRAVLVDKDGITTVDIYEY